jgi:hypothetical protein
VTVGLKVEVGDSLGVMVAVLPSGGGVGVSVMVGLGVMLGEGVAVGRKGSQSCPPTQPRSVHAGSCLGKSGPANKANASTPATACRMGKIERIGANEERAKTTPTSGVAASPWCRTEQALSRRFMTYIKANRPDSVRKSPRSFQKVGFGGQNQPRQNVIGPGRSAPYTLSHGRIRAYPSITFPSPHKRVAGPMRCFPPVLFVRVLLGGDWRRGISGI